MQANTEKPTKVKFATQADPEVLETLRGIAASEGRQIQAIIDEALREYIENRRGVKPRKHVLQAFGNSLAKYDDLYKELSK
ncbi:hypothetical protein LJC48_07165 [Desulfovibrio sp. OttesenSCG-928-C06]|nr:hypothetical protein [Desulfovibrio sp. OttesenSCG-928-C06]